MINENYEVAILSETISLELGIPPDKAWLIRQAALTHDIGKMHIDKRIINKPGRLTKAEFKIVKTHVNIGAQMLSHLQNPLREIAMTVAKYHHEWADGSGYLGISTNQLPDYVSIVGIADVYCALIHSRPYKDAWSKEQAFEYLQKQAGTQFSHALVNNFINIVKKGGIRDRPLYSFYKGTERYRKPN